jgi:stress response protein YsnF
MSRVVIAGFQEEADAEDALTRLSAEVALIDAAVVGRGPLGLVALLNLELSDAQRENCADKLEQTPFLVVARVPNDHTVERAVSFLRSELTPPRADEPVTQEEAPEEVAVQAVEQPAREEAAPASEEELRVGEPQMVRGGARVQASLSEPPAREEEYPGLERRPAGRRLTDEEVIAGGLLKDRVIEISEMREEAVVAKEAHVREELIIRKTTQQHVEHIDETVRRTEADVEELPGG